MKQAFFRIYEELNNYLPAEQQKVWFQVSFAEGATIKDLMQMLGIPAEEIDLVLVDQQSCPLGYLLKGNERISVFPIFERLNIAPVGQLHSKPLRNPRFCCDVHLGKLAKYLRMLGFDTVYTPFSTAEDLQAQSIREKRILLSRSLRLIHHPAITHAYWVRSSDPDEQIKDLLKKLDLYETASPLTRCLRCNQPLETIEKKDISHQLEPNTKRFYQTFFICPHCTQLYWQGSHFEHMMAFVKQLINPNANEK